MESLDEGQSAYKPSYKGPADPVVVWRRARIQAGVPEGERTPDELKPEVCALFIKLCAQIVENGEFELPINE